MRIVVVSDTHGDIWALREAVSRQKHAEAVIHLGDGADELETVQREFPEKAFFGVRGNNDWSCPLPYSNVISLAGNTIFYTHGHYYHVKYGLYDFLSAARGNGAQIALYGHTHEPMTDYQDGLYVMSPGALGGVRGSYGIIDLTPAGIVTNIIFLF